MAVRFTSSFHSTHNDINWRVDIIDTNFVGTATTISLAGEGFELVYQQQSDERFKAIKGSECKVYCLVTNDAAGSALANWINSSLNATKEDQYFVGIYKDTALYWFGVFLPDLNTAEDASKPYQYTIAATDGLARLKSKPFGLAKTVIDQFQTYGTYAGRQTFKDCVYDILKLTPLYGYTSETILFSTSVNWIENRMDTPSSTFDPFDNTKISMFAFAKLLENNVYEAISAYDALVTICESWGMRVMLSDGFYRFYQVNSYVNDGITLYERTYRLDTGGFENSFEFSKYIVSTNNTDYPHIKAGNQFSNFAPLKNIYLKFPFPNTNMLDSGENMELSTVDGLFAYRLKQELRDNILGGVGKSLKFNTTLIINFDIPTIIARIDIAVKLKIGTNYLQKDIIGSSVSWTSVSTDRYEFSLTNIILNSHNEIPFYFETPEIPSGSFDANEFDLYITRIEEISSGNIYAPLFDYNAWRVVGSTNLSYITSDSNNVDSYFQYIGGNTSTPINSYDLTLEDSVIGENNDPSAFSGLYVYNGSSWLYSSGKWDIGAKNASSNLDFNLIRMQEILAGQTKATQKYQGSIIGGLDAHSCLYYGGTYYIFNGGTYSAQSEVFDGEWFEVDEDRASWYEIQGATNQSDGGGEGQLRREIGSLTDYTALQAYLVQFGLTFIKTISADTTIDARNQTILVDTGGVTITLAPAADWVAYGCSSEITTKHIGGSGVVVVAAQSGEKVDGVDSINLSPNEANVLISDGTNIWIKSKK